MTQEDNLPKRLLTAEDEKDILAFLATAKKLEATTLDLEEAVDKLKQSDSRGALLTIVIVLARTLEITNELLPMIKLLLERTEIISFEEEK